jgi:3-oxoacyl-[acyl-carrier-protein] synthase II
LAATTRVWFSDGRELVKHRVGVAGIGVVSPIGIGREAYWRALGAGCDGAADLRLFDTAAWPAHRAAQVLDFDAAALIGSKGLKYLDRPSRFAVAATELAFRDAHMPVDSIDPLQCGIVLGLAYGGVSNMQNFTRERVLEGPGWVSPTTFTSTPINGPSFPIPIRYKMKRLNVTISSGMTSGVDAIRYAALLLQRMTEATLLCGGVEELCPVTFGTSSVLNELAGGSGDEVSRPFDRRRNGYLLGEGCALVVLETIERAARGSRQPLAEICGYGSSFVAADGGRERGVEAVSSAMRRALQHAQVGSDQIGLVLASANSSVETDLVEARAIARVFGDRGVPVSAIKSMTGEAMGASGAFQIAAAILAVKCGVLPPTINTETLDPECAALDLVLDCGRTNTVRYALVNAIDRSGSVVSVVVGRANDY